MSLSKKLNAGLFTVVLAIMLLSQSFVTVAASNLQSIMPSALQTTTESFEVIPDPSLHTGVALHTHGDSVEFNASHVIAEGISSYVNLTWTHVAGTELQLVRLPDLWDFCYFTVSFPWEKERVPTDAMFYITYGVQMFKVHSWLIDSSDDWEPLLESEPPYTTSARLYSYDLNYFDLIPGWEWMVQNDAGIQEDPEDILQVAVGLAPSENFDSYNDGYPWQEYDGSVTLLVNTLSLVVTLEPEETASMNFELYHVAAPVGIIVAVVVLYLIWRRKES